MVEPPSILGPWASTLPPCAHEPPPVCAFQECLSLNPFRRYDGSGWWVGVPHGKIAICRFLTCAEGGLTGAFGWLLASGDDVVATLP